MGFAYETTYSKNGAGIMSYSLSYSREKSNALYILDDELNIIGELKDMAKGEEVYSARFMGDTAYFVTYLQVDPLFAVDLSNPENPVILSELKIPGFSEYLHPWGNNKLLGIGYEDGNIKISMFDIEDKADVKETGKCILNEMYYARLLYNYKAGLIDSGKNIIGFWANRYSGTYYFIFRENNGEFEMAESLDLAEVDRDIYDVRGLYLDDKIYVVLQTGKMVIYDLNTVEKLGIVNY